MGFTSRKRGGDVTKKKNKDKFVDDGGKARRGGVGATSGNGGARVRIISRKGLGGDVEDSATQGAPAVVDPNAPLRRRKPIDLTLLSRGMSARAVGSRVSSSIKVLTDEEIEKDLRHMNAYEVACTTYSQQFFAFTNQELVSRGVYGPVPPLPGSPGYSGPGIGRSQGYDPASGQYHPPSAQGSPSAYQRSADGRMIPISGSPTSVLSSQATPFAMPVKIDPEEEKRLAQLKKKITVSEAKREALEGEYESIKAHYWYACKVLDRTKKSVVGQLELLKDVVQRRGKVVALRRVRCAVARDILACLEAREKGLPIGTSKSKGGSLTAKDNEGAKAMDIAEETGDGKGTNGEEKKDSADVPVEKKTPEFKDLVECWNWIDAQLNEAELACSEATAPADLIALKDVLADQKKSKAADAAGAEGDSRSKSPIRGKSGENKKKDKRGSSDEGDISDANGKDIDSALFIGDDGILPWVSQTMPRTPHGVPVYYSYLSSAPDRAGAFGTGGAFGGDPSSLAWLGPNLPKSFEPDYTKDREELDRLREEVEYLAEELEMERDNNKELQSEIISNRNKSDEMCSMMSILRTETEAVLNRHNIIVASKEAKKRAKALHKSQLELLGGDSDIERSVYVDRSGQEASEGAAAAGAFDGEKNNAAGDATQGGYDAPFGDAGTYGEEPSNKRAFDGGDSDSPSRSNGGFNASKRRRRM